MVALSEAFQAHSKEINQAITARLRQLPAYAVLPLDQVRERVELGLTAFRKDLDLANPTHFASYWKTVAMQRAQQGMPIDAFMDALIISNQELIDGIKQAYANEPREQTKVVEQCYLIVTRGIAAIYTGYQQYKDQVISSQESALAEISTPIIPVFEGILVLPVVGSIDSHRAGQIMESLLENISNQSASVVILDITGVPVIDTGVANYLLQAARAARLLGSDVVLVGIGPEIAQTIVQLGIDLTGITTRANLQGGIEYALAKRGLAIKRA